MRKTANFPLNVSSDAKAEAAIMELAHRRLGRRTFLIGMGAAGLIFGAGPTGRHGLAHAAEAGSAAGSLEQAFRLPPDEARAWAYWWWLDGAATTAGITADLTSMKEQGLSGVILVDGGLGGPDAPKGPLFMSA